MSNAVTIKVLDREYTVGCPPEQVESLQAAAGLLDKQILIVINKKDIERHLLRGLDSFFQHNVLFTPP